MHVQEIGVMKKEFKLLIPPTSSILIRKNSNPFYTPPPPLQIDPHPPSYKVERGEPKKPQKRRGRRSRRRREKKKRRRREEEGEEEPLRHPPSPETPSLKSTPSKTHPRPVPAGRSRCRSFSAKITRLSLFFAGFLTGFRKISRPAGVVLDRTEATTVKPSLLSPRPQLYPPRCLPTVAGNRPERFSPEKKKKKEEGPPSSSTFSGQQDPPPAKVRRPKSRPHCGDQIQAKSSRCPSPNSPKKRPESPGDTPLSGDTTAGRRLSGHRTTPDRLLLPLASVLGCRRTPPSPQSPSLELHPS